MCRLWYEFLRRTDCLTRVGPRRVSRLDEFWDASMVAADDGSWAESCQRQYLNPTQEGATEARRALAISYVGLVTTVRFDRTC